MHITRVISTQAGGIGHYTGVWWCAEADVYRPGRGSAENCRADSGLTPYLSDVWLTRLLHRCTDRGKLVTECSVTYFEHTPRWKNTIFRNWLPQINTRNLQTAGPTQSYLRLGLRANKNSNETPKSRFKNQCPPTM